MPGAGCTKKFRLNGRLLARRSSSIWSRAVRADNVAQESEPSAPAFETAATNAGPLRLPIGAWMIGWVMPSRSMRSVRGHILTSMCATSALDSGRYHGRPGPGQTRFAAIFEPGDHDSAPTDSRAGVALGLSGGIIQTAFADPA